MKEEAIDPGKSGPERGNDGKNIENGGTVTTMLTILTSDNQVQISISATFTWTGILTEFCREFVRIKSRADPTPVTVIFRELLSNAICHVNMLNRGKRVSLLVTYLDEGYFEIIVEEHGQGVDFADMGWDQSNQDRPLGRRGLALVQKLAEKLEFSNNGRHIRAITRVMEPDNYINMHRDNTVR